MHFEKLLLLLIQLSLLRTSDLQQSCLNILSDSQVRVKHVYLQNELTSLGIKSKVSLLGEGLYRQCLLPNPIM